MDKKIKIRVSELAMYGQKVIVPNDGEVSIDSDGILEVSEQTAKLLLENTSSYVEIEAKQKDDSSKGKPKTNDTKGKKPIEENEEETGLTKESLSELETPELVEILKQAGIDDKSYSKFITKKGLLINFILKTIK